MKSPLIKIGILHYFLIIFCCCSEDPLIKSECLQDANSQLVKTSRGLTSEYNYEYLYDDKDRLKTLTNSYGGSYKFTYDSLGRVKEVTYGESYYKFFRNFNETIIHWSDASSGFTPAIDTQFLDSKDHIIRVTRTFLDSSNGRNRMQAFVEYSGENISEVQWDIVDQLGNSLPWTNYKVIEFANTKNPNTINPLREMYFDNLSFSNLNNVVTLVIDKNQGFPSDTIRYGYDYDEFGKVKSRIERREKYQELINFNYACK